VCVTLGDGGHRADSVAVEGAQSTARGSSRIGAVRRSNRDADGCLLAGGVGASASADGFRLRVVRRSSVLFVALQSALLLRERMDARRMGAAILVFIGIVLIWLA